MADDLLPYAALSRTKLVAKIGVPSDKFRSRKVGGKTVKRVKRLAAKNH